MRAIEPRPNLLLVGAPKSGTTSLLMWLRGHPEIYHPWSRAGSNAVESGFLIAGPSEFPVSPFKPRGTLLLPHEADMDHYKGERWIIDKSPQHLYSKKALETVRDLMPDARVIITLRDPVDLLVSLYSQMWKSDSYQTTFDELLGMMKAQDWEPDIDKPETWMFLAYPRYSSFVREWASELGSDRVRVVRLSSIADAPNSVLESLGDWLGIGMSGMPRTRPSENTTGKLSNSKFRRFLRKPPGWAFSTARLLLPSRAIRRAVLDPIRRMGWKRTPAEKPQIGQVFGEDIRDALRQDIEFYEGLASEIPERIVL